MPKLILDNFLGGLKHQDRGIEDTQFYVGEGIDIHTDPGYLRTFLQPTNIVRSDDATAIIRDLIIASAVYPPSDICWFMGANGDIYEMDSITNETWDANFDGASHYYYAIPGFSFFGGEDLFIYHINGAPRLFFSWNTTGAGDIGTFVGGSFDPDYMSVSAAGGVALAKSYHPMLEWQTYMWVGNGRYVAKFDGDTGTNGTFDNDAFDVGRNWVVRSMFKTNNFLGICANKENASKQLYNESKVFLWDGNKSKADYIIPIDDNVILSSFSIDNEVYLITSGRQKGTVLRKLTENGSEVINTLVTVVNNSETYLNGPRNHNGLTFFRNMVWIGEGTGPDVITAYGSPDATYPKAFTYPIPFQLTSGFHVGFIKPVTNNKLYFSSKENTLYRLVKIDFTSATRIDGTFKSGYKDFGQKVRLNYIKFYFKALASGDAVTPTLDLDYGTSFTLADRRGNAAISFANDGAVTSKIYQIKKECHSFRVNLASWTGVPAIAKIIVDYDFVSDET